ncbi:hypothetical protein YB2330_002588 [Saitoella coloradoensis]
MGGSYDVIRDAPGINPTTDISQCAQVIHRALLCDPVIKYILRTAKSQHVWQDFHRWVLLAATRRQGGSLHLYQADSFKGVMCLVPPGCPFLGKWNQFRAGVLAVIPRIGLKGVMKASCEYANALAAAKRQAKIRDDDAWQLVYMCVVHEPSCTKTKEVPNRLLAVATRLADESNKAIFVALSTAKYASVFEVHGFRAVGERRLGYWDQKCWKINQYTMAMPYKGKDGEGVVVKYMVRYPHGKGM